MFKLCVEVVVGLFQWAAVNSGYGKFTYLWKDALPLENISNNPALCVDDLITDRKQKNKKIKTPNSVSIRQNEIKMHASFILRSLPIFRLVSLDMLHRATGKSMMVMWLLLLSRTLRVL